MTILEKRNGKIETGRILPLLLNRPTPGLLLPLFPGPRTRPDPFPAWAATSPAPRPPFPSSSSAQLARAGPAPHRAASPLPSATDGRAPAAGCRLPRVVFYLQMATPPRLPLRHASSTPVHCIWPPRRWIRSPTPRPRAFPPSPSLSTTQSPQLRRCRHGHPGSSSSPAGRT